MESAGCGAAAPGSAFILASALYDALSRRQSLTLRNGTAASSGYSARGDLLSHDWTKPASPPLTADLASYDFGYNGVGQVVMEQVSNTALRWTPALNPGDAYAANGLNQYGSINGAAVSYDGNGNMTKDAQARHFTHDAENVLRKAGTSAGGAVIATYAYHGDGTRRRKTAGAIVSDFYYAGDQGDHGVLGIGNGAAPLRAPPRLRR